MPIVTLSWKRMLRPPRIPVGAISDRNNGTACCHYLQPHICQKTSLFILILLLSLPKARIQKERKSFEIKRINERISKQQSVGTLWELSAFGNFGYKILDMIWILCGNLCYCGKRSIMKRMVRQAKDVVWPKILILLVCIGKRPDLKFKGMNMILNLRFPNPNDLKYEAIVSRRLSYSWQIPFNRSIIFLPNLSQQFWCHKISSTKGY